MRYTVRTHGYSAYTHGCRCKTCKRAKAGYSSARRAAAYLEPQPAVQGITHGRFGYEERGCRCDVCVEAKRAMWRQSGQRRAARAAAA